MINILAPVYVYRNKLQLHVFKILQNLWVTTSAILPKVNLPRLLLKLWLKKQSRAHFSVCYQMVQLLQLQFLSKDGPWLFVLAI